MFAQGHVKSRRVQLEKVHTELSLANLNTKAHPPAKRGELLWILISNYCVPDQGDKVAIETVHESPKESGYRFALEYGVVPIVSDLAKRCSRTDTRS